MKKKRAITIRLGPLGLSLLAAGVTAAAFAAISLADNGSGSSGNSGSTNGPQTLAAPGPPGGGAGVMTFRRPNLSAADRQKMDQFRQCMQDNGAPAPPDPSNIDPSNPPKPPSQSDQQKIQKAYEACKGKLPQDMQNAGPPRIGQCGPPPGAPPPGQPGQQGQQQNQG
jgi:hypothetical protein